MNFHRVERVAVVADVVIVAVVVADAIVVVVIVSSLVVVIVEAVISLDVVVVIDRNVSDDFVVKVLPSYCHEKKKIICRIQFCWKHANEIS